jgi:CDP-glucose 4,6-dehydratase
MINLLKKFKGKKIIITGHTGFKGSWLTLWLIHLGANVTGISDKIPTNPSNFVANKLEKKINHLTFNIKDKKKLSNVINKIKPDYIFHLAAQSLVKKSYTNPVETFETNSMGTLNLLEALKQFKLRKKCSVVIITSDKSYKNLEIKRGYKENDILGGHDPYSASKACAELIIQCYMNSFMKDNKRLFISVARAGNVIGGGDWSKDRLIPDCIRSINKRENLQIRFAKSTRPWQHVLEALYGYMILAIKQKDNKKIFGNTFNFGPNNKSSLSVIDLVKKFKKNWPNLNWEIVKIKKKVFESGLLKLNSDKALKILNWKCILNANQTILMLVNWYKFYYQKRSNLTMYNYSISQIKYYERLVNNKPYSTKTLFKDKDNFF